MPWAPASLMRRLFSSEHGASDRLIPRWLFLRALGLIYFSAFFSLVFQIRGLIGPEGILPANEYLQAVTRSFDGYTRFWFAPTLLWISSSSHMLMALCWLGMAASLLLVLNLWPRGVLVICFLCFLSFIAAAGDFSSYQSDGMLLEAGFISLFFAPPGFRPGLGAAHPPSRASLFLLQWEWFRIYFESGIVKLASGDPQWRHLTAMNEYYQNGPLPTWIGWYAQHLPHWFHVGTAFTTLAVELVLVWMFFLPRRFRIIFFWIATSLQIGIILTANYTFLNYLVLVLGILLLDDRYFDWFVSLRWKKSLVADREKSLPPSDSKSTTERQPERTFTQQHFAAVKLAISSVMLTWIFYVTTAELLLILFRRLPLPTRPIVVLEPFRIANQYGLFAVMTRGRYEIEFQGSNDGQNWTAYPFRYKPQDPGKPPGIYAPYQPRFDWNLWFASLGSWRQYSLVPNTEIRLLSNDRDVLTLFAGNPFANAPPRQVRAVLWQYWFTTMAEKRATGLWWRRQLIGLYAPVLERADDGRIGVVQWPEVSPRE
jgi:lipase maturation factor 1